MYTVLLLCLFIHSVSCFDCFKEILLYNTSSHIYWSWFTFTKKKKKKPLYSQCHAYESRIWMQRLCTGTGGSLYGWWTWGILAKKSWQDESRYIFSCNCTCLHGAGYILKSVHIVQMLTIQNKGCEFFRSLVMRVCAPVYLNGLLPHTTSSGNKHQSVQSRSSFWHQNT